MGWFRRDRKTEGPTLRQFGDLTADDFEGNAIWVQCHTVDYDEPWYDKTDEETFRPWAARTPVDPANGMFLLAAQFTLADGTVRSGFITPVSEEDSTHGLMDLGASQPTLLAEEAQIGFWNGIFELDGSELDRRYDALGRPREGVFPIRFAALPGLTRGVVTGEIPGFCSSPDLQNVVVAK